MCLTSFSSVVSSLDTIIARFTKPAIMPDLTESGWWESYCTYLFVCVGFWYTCLWSLPFAVLVKRTSMKGSEPSSSSSIVNLMFGCCSFRWSSSGLPLSRLTTARTSSTNLFHSRGQILPSDSALSSKSSMNISETTAFVFSFSFSFIFPLLWFVLRRSKCSEWLLLGVATMNKSVVVSSRRCLMLVLRVRESWVSVQGCAKLPMKQRKDWNEKVVKDSN